MANPTLAPGETAPRKTGADLVATLQKHPHVVLWVNGHTHRNDVIAHPGAGGGFWEVNTAAHIDFPHQSRIVEIADNGDGTLSIFGTIVDADAPLTISAAASYAAPGTPAALAGLARELGANDPQNRTEPSNLQGGRRGTPEVRNVELLVATPPGFGLGSPSPRPTAAASRPPAHPDPMPRTGLPSPAPEVAAAVALAAAGLAAAARRRSSADPDVPGEGPGGAA
jgi:hypothetical protein